jgi:hypothetical protein
MALDLLQYARFTGPAFPETFVRFELEKELNRMGLLPKNTGSEGRELQSFWDVYRRKLRELVSSGGPIRVRNHVIDPLITPFGYKSFEDASDVQTREGLESGGHIMANGDGARLRIWVTALGEDLDAPARRGHAYRFSHVRIAQRVLLTCNECVGLLTNGQELRILISDPARPDSQIEISIDPSWKRSREVPDTYRLLIAITSSKGIQAVPKLVEKARLQQTRVTKELRHQARQAVDLFVQEVLYHPENREHLAALSDKEKLARTLWQESLIVIYRLLFILKLESSDDPARSFSFASTSLWRNSFSPSVALARYVRELFDHEAETGHILEDGLRSLFRMFTNGIQCTELRIEPFGGALFGEQSTPLMSNLRWGERAVGYLLDRLLWTPKQRGSTSRERVHYGPLDVEDLGRVYETLIELEPGVTTEQMCRLRRQKLEVVVPVAQGERYRPAIPTPEGIETEEIEEVDEVQEGEEPEGEEEVAPPRGKKTKVEWIEEIPPGRFFLRAGLGRKASGSYYTPHSFVRFLVQETLGPQVGERSHKDDPQPLEILKLKVLDPAMGSGHFLVEACRFLGEKLYEACRLCDEQALASERRVEKAKNDSEREAALAEANTWRQRIIDLPDPNDELLKYLPSRAPEGEESGFSQKKAEALCCRLVAVHCIYGVDKNPLAVELAKLSLWIESHAEGLPLTFLDHRFVLGDSLTGPFFEHLLKYPGSQKPMEDLFTQGLRERFTQALDDALKKVKDLEASVGISLSELEAKQAAKAQLDKALAPFKIIAAAWAGGVMLGSDKCDDVAYASLIHALSNPKEFDNILFSDTSLQHMIARGFGADVEITKVLLASKLKSFEDTAPALPYEFAFPEVFFPEGEIKLRRGFDVVLGNPPWDRMLPAEKEFFASYDFGILDAPTKRERTGIEKRLLSNESIRIGYMKYIDGFRGTEHLVDSLYRYQVVEINGSKTIGKQDLFRVFMERNAQLLDPRGVTGVVVPSAFHANEGATGIRRLYLEKMGFKRCYSFENRRKLFEIHRSFKFALVVASHKGPTTDFPCAFYLHDDEWLFGDKKYRELIYTLEFIRQTGGEYLSFLELKSPTDFEVAQYCFKNGKLFGKICNQLGIQLARELNMSDDIERLSLTNDILQEGDDPRDPDTFKRLLLSGFLPVHEGKTFHQYDDHWSDRPSFCIHISKIQHKRIWLENARFYRLVNRKIASSTNERTAIFTILPPGVITLYSCAAQQVPYKTCLKDILGILAISNSFCFDWCSRQQVGANFQDNIRDGLPIPYIPGSFHIHSALRLSCTHLGYEQLWCEQLREIWREGKVPFTWPVLVSEDERWAVRSAIDAVVADAYGLLRDQYIQVLSSFNHASCPKAPDLCLARFDELKAIGLHEFAKKYDPYWDIPLNENLPKPVIELPDLDSESLSSSEVREPSGVYYGSKGMGPLFRGVKKNKGKGKKQ